MLIQLPHKAATFGKAAIVARRSSFVTVTTDGTSQMHVVPTVLLTAQLDKLAPAEDA